MAIFTFDTDWGLPVLSIVIGLTIALIGYFGRREKTDTVHETRLSYIEKEIEGLKKRLDRVYNMLLSNGQPSNNRRRGNSGSGRPHSSQPQSSSSQSSQKDDDDEYEDSEYW